MKAIQIIAPEEVKVVDIPVPEVASNEVLVKVQACATCPHWDITLFSGVDIFERPDYPKYPIAPGRPGHEMAGDVAAVGANVTALKEGDRVATLVTGPEDETGFYCEFINRPEDTVVKIPDNMTYEAASSMEMARYVASYVRLLGEVTGKRTGVTGVGPAGLIALQELKALGASEVVAIDIIEERLALARQLGADQTVNGATEEIEQLKDRPLEATVDCSGASAGLQTALDNTRGPIAIFGVPHGSVTYGLRHWGSSLLSGTGPAAEDTELVLKLWGTGQLDTASLISASLPFEDYANGIRMLMERKGIKVAFCPEG